MKEGLLSDVNTVTMVMPIRNAMNEKNQVEVAERDYFHWQELLRKRYKKA